jgi:hypothetical protein
VEADQAVFLWTPAERLGIEALLGYFVTVATCIDQRSCDPDVTLALFRREMVPFLNGTCGLLALNPVSRFDAKTIARVIREVDGAAAPGWSIDERRSQQFLCNWLRV